MLLIAALLAAHRAGGVAAALRLRPALARRVARRVWPAFLWASGGSEDERPWLLLLRAAVASLRPDGPHGVESPEAEAWLRRPAWRPYLALACHQGLLTVPALEGRFGHRTHGAPARQLADLWEVSTSSFYRYLDQARLSLATAAAGPGWWDALAHEVQQDLGLVTAAQRQAWHGRCRAKPLPAAQALWHSVRAHDLPGALVLLQRHRVELAGHAMAAAWVEQLPAPAHATLQVRLLLAQAGLALVRGDAAEERRLLEAAMALASASKDPALAGAAGAALGKFYETRDPQRALAYYGESMLKLRAAWPLADEELRAEYLATLVKLAYQKLQSNDDGARGLLDEAEQLRADLPDDRSELALLEQCWGEYWRRAGDIDRAIACKLQALNRYERLGELQQVLKTWVNLGLLYAHQKDHARSVQALDHVLEAAKRHRLQPDMVASAHLNLGATRYGQGRLEAAIDHYRQALDIARGQGLRVLAGRAHFNLAEAHYKRFLATESPQDEQLGDSHAAAALATWPADTDPAAAEATRRLRGEMLGQEQAFVHDRLWPAEALAHPVETSVIAEHRAQLSKPAAGLREQALSRLAIAEAYADIAARERAGLLAFIAQHGLEDEVGGPARRLAGRFERDLPAQARLAAQWRERAGRLLAEAEGQAVAAQLLQEGALTKSSYAQWGRVSLATASRHLAQLAEAGLLVREGSGPGTRYRLPPEGAGLPRAA